MDDGRIVGMEEDHSFSYLLGNLDSRIPWEPIIGFMQEIEESGTFAELIDNIEVFVMLADSDESDQLGVMPDLDRSHYLSLELFGGPLRIYIIFYLLDCYLSSSPFAFEHLRRVSIPNLLSENQGCEIDDVLLSILLDFFHNELLQIDKIVFWRRSLGTFLARRIAASLNCFNLVFISFI
jgi:hypothetical protein